MEVRNPGNGGVGGRSVDRRCRMRLKFGSGRNLAPKKMRAMVAAKLIGRGRGFNKEAELR